MTKPKKPRGFATLSPERRREIAAMGGASKNRDPATRSFSLDNTFAVNMGRKGGQKSRRKALTDNGDKV